MTHKHIWNNIHINNYSITKERGNERVKLLVSATNLQLQPSNVIEMISLERRKAIPRRKEEKTLPLNLLQRTQEIKLDN